MKRPKYGNVKTEIDGIFFDSAKEARRYSELKLLERAGEITAMRCQPKFPLVINGVNCGFYKGDFIYLDKSGASICEDVKGFKTPVYNLKKKLVRAIYNFEITEV